MTSTADTDEAMREFDREMLRAEFLSLFWAVIEHRKLQGTYRLADLANQLGVHKSVITRWFSKEPKNWTIDTIADIANALDVELILRGRDRKDGTRYTPAGAEPVVRVTTTDGRDARTMLRPGRSEQISQLVPAS